MSTPPVTLDQLKQEMGFDPGFTDDDSLLLGDLAAATTQVEALVGPMSQGSTTDLVRNVDWCGSVMLKQWPILGLTEVSVHGGDSVDITTLDLDPDTGVLSGLRYCVRYDVTYSVGRSPVPYDLQKATMIVAEQLYQTGRGAIGGSRFVQNGVGDGQQVPVYKGYAWPNRAVQLCQPYRQQWVG